MDLQITSLVLLTIELSEFPHNLYISNACMLKVKTFGTYRFEEEHLNMGSSGNLDSSVVESARLVSYQWFKSGLGSNFSLENLIYFIS